MVQFNHDAEQLIVFPYPKSSHFVAVSFILLPKDRCWPPPASVWPVWRAPSTGCGLLVTQWVVTGADSCACSCLSGAGVVSTSFVPLPGVHKSHNLMQERKQHVSSSFLPELLLFSKTAVWHLELLERCWFCSSFFAKETLTVQDDPWILHDKSQVDLCCAKELSGPDHGDHTLLLESL